MVNLPPLTKRQQADSIPIRIKGNQAARLQLHSVILEYLKHRRTRELTPALPSVSPCGLRRRFAVVCPAATLPPVLRPPNHLPSTAGFPPSYFSDISPMKRFNTEGCEVVMPPRWEILVENQSHKASSS